MHPSSQLNDAFSLQTLKNALSPYRLGGSSGGSDFDPKGRSDNEVLHLFFNPMVITLEIIKSIDFYLLDL